MLMPRVTQIIILLILLASALGLSSCTTESPAPPVNLELSFPHGAPHLNKTAELLCLVRTPALSADNVTVKINLPDGLQLVSGNLSAQFGTMSKGDVRELKAIIKPIKVGNYAIEAKLTLVPPQMSTFHLGPGLYTVYLSVAENWAQWGKYPPGYHPPPPSISPYEE
jgi:hypothetical protein